MVSNSRIHVFFDHWNNDKVVWESNDMLEHITKNYDCGKKLVDSIKDRSNMSTRRCQFGGVLKAVHG